MLDYYRIWIVDYGAAYGVVWLVPTQVLVGKPALKSPMTLNICRPELTDLSRIFCPEIVDTKGAFVSLLERLRNILIL